MVGGGHKLTDVSHPYIQKQPILKFGEPDIHQTSESLRPRPRFMTDSLHAWYVFN